MTLAFICNGAWLPSALPKRGDVAFPISWGYLYSGLLERRTACRQASFLGSRLVLILCCSLCMWYLGATKKGSSWSCLGTAREVFILMLLHSFWWCPLVQLYYPLYPFVLLLPPPMESWFPLMEMYLDPCLLSADSRAPLPVSDLGAVGGAGNLHFWPVLGWCLVPVLCWESQL